MKKYEIIEDALKKLGGKGSGHWGHAGRATTKERGGSVPRSTAMSIRTGPDWQERQAEAKRKQFGSAKVTSSSPLGVGQKGINDSMILEFEDGTKGIFKPGDTMDYGCVESEVLAYEFSESIGWNLVPETIMYTHEGKSGSLQKWVDDTEIAKFYKGKLTADPKVDEMKKRMGAMDVLLENRDRHNGNWLYDEGRGRIWAIDNGGMFGVSFGGKPDSAYYTPYTPTSKGPVRDIVAWRDSPKATAFMGKLGRMMGKDCETKFREAIGRA